MPKKHTAMIKPRHTHCANVPFTEIELLMMFGLTVEQALAKGMNVAKKKPPGSGNSTGGKGKINI